MATRKHIHTTKHNNTVRSRVDGDFKRRLTMFRKQPHVQRSEGFIVRRAVEEYLERHEAKAA